MLRKIQLLVLCSIIWMSCDSTEPAEVKIGKPTNLVLAKDGEKSFTIDWQRAANDKFDDTLRITKSGEPLPMIVIIPSPTSSTGYTDGSPSFTGGTYTVTISSRDSISAPATITLDNPYIGKPQNLQLTQSGDTTFLIQWQRAANDLFTDTVHVTKAGSPMQTKLVYYPTSSMTFGDTDQPFTGGTYTVTVNSKDSMSETRTITLPPIVPDYGKPKDLMVTSIDATSIRARWTRANGDIGADTLIATPVGGGAPTSLVVPTGEIGTITGLAQGTRYGIQAASTGARTRGIEWATATRSATITLYETADNTAGHDAGLILGPIAASASITGSDKNKIDLVLVTDNNEAFPYLSLQGADVAGSGIPGGRATRMGDFYFIVSGGLDNDFYKEGFDSTIGQVNYFPDFNATTDPVIILARTADNHYARIEIVPQSNGKLWKDVPVGSQSYRAIDVIVSYQTIPGFGYASRPNRITRGFNTPKVGGARAVVKK